MVGPLFLAKGPVTSRVLIVMVDAVFRLLLLWLPLKAPKEKLATNATWCHQFCLLCCFLATFFCLR